jgi:hypothetical protein
MTYDGSNDRNKLNEGKWERNYKINKNTIRL